MIRWRARVLYEVERFLRVTGMSWTRFGRLAARDPRLVEDLRNGREPRPPLAARIRAFIKFHGETGSAN